MFLLEETEMVLYEKACGAEVYSGSCFSFLHFVAVTILVISSCTFYLEVRFLGKSVRRLYGTKQEENNVESVHP